MAQLRHKWDPVCPPPRGLVWPVPLDPTGVNGPTRGRARSRGWRRTTRGYYVPSSVDPDVVEQRILEKSVLLPTLGAVTGWSGCRLHGGTFFDGLLPDGVTERPVSLCIGPLGQVREKAGVVLSRERLLPTEVTYRHGIAVTPVLRSLFDEMRYVREFREAVVAMDMMAAAEKVSLRQMRDYLLLHPGWTGVPQARAALALADEDSRSPAETRMRLIWQLDAGFPRPMVNKPVFDLNGRLLGIADILDPVAGVVGEYDGADHRGAKRHSRDVAREEDFRRAGLEYFKVVGPDQRNTDLVVSRMSSTRARAKWLTEDRAWTLEPPPDWGEYISLDQRLEERAMMAEVYAQYEREGDPDVRDIINL